MTCPRSHEWALNYWSRICRFTFCIFSGYRCKTKEKDGDPIEEDDRGRLHQKFLIDSLGPDWKKFVLRIEDNQTVLVYGQISLSLKVTIIPHLASHLNAQLYIKRCWSVRLFNAAPSLGFYQERVQALGSDQVLAPSLTVCVPLRKLSNFFV